MKQDGLENGITYDYDEEIKDPEEFQRELRAIDVLEGRTNGECLSGCDEAYGTGFEERIGYAEAWGCFSGIDVNVNDDFGDFEEFSLRGGALPPGLYND